jgi:3-hydroxyisobutyrate dehydrogenase-like beta-hydroxyacid dehydrogenase
MGAAVAVIGTGRMGAAMAGRLAGAGHDVTVWNRTRARAAEAAGRSGAAVADTAREAAAAADVVLVSLADDAAVDAAYSGDDGVTAGLRDGAVVLEASTVRPETVRRLAPAVAARGATLLDTPVSGSVSVVESGALTVMVGGDAAALDGVRDVLAPLAAKVFHLGPAGAGATMKIVVNGLLMGLNQALAEAVVLAEKAGIARADAYDVFAASAVAAPFVQYKRQAYVEPENAPVAFMLDLVVKDLGLATDLARQVGARGDQLAVNLAVAQEAVARGLGGRDLSAVADLLRDPG